MCSTPHGPAACRYSPLDSGDQHTGAQHGGRDRGQGGSAQFHAFMTR